MKEIRYEYSSEISRCAYTAAFIRILPQSVLICLLSFALLVISYYSKWDSVQSDMLNIACGTIIIVICLIPLMILIFTIKTNNEWKSLKEKYYLIQFYDDKVTVKTPLASSDIPWTTFSRFTLTKKYCYLWYRNRICVIIPISLLDEELNQMIRTKIITKK